MSISVQNGPRIEPKIARHAGWSLMVYGTWISAGSVLTEVSMATADGTVQFHWTGHETVAGGNGSGFFVPAV